MTRILLAVTGLGFLTGISLWLLSSGSRGADTATVLSFSVSVLALAVTIFSSRSQAPADDNDAMADAARALAVDVRKRETDQQLRLLADTGEPEPANVGFREPTLVRWRSDGGTQHGSIKEIKVFYADLRHGRLVILGAGGAGKTVLANQLLIDLIGSDRPGGPPPADAFQVPVRISLASFNPGDNIDGTAPAQMRFRLDEWIASYLTEVHGLAPRVARALLRQRRILPVLDGLDEMDSAGDPSRAAAVIRSLNHPVDGTLSPVVLTCRTDRYEQLAAAHYGPGRQSVLEDATAVEIEPLSPAQISAYLTYRFPDPARRSRVHRIQERWRPVVTNVTRQPNGALAAVLGSPLRLFLAVTAYYNPATNPAELIGLPADDLDSHLLDQLIPAVAAQHPRPNGGYYDPGDVTRWLTTFAGYLGTERGTGGDPAASDIDLHNLYTIAGHRVRLLAAALRGVLAVIPLIVLVVGYRQLMPSFPGAFLLPQLFLSDFYPTPWQLLGFGALLIILGAAWAASQTGTEVRRLDLAKLRTAKARARVAAGLATGLGLGLGLGISLAGGIPAGLSLGLAVGLGLAVPAGRHYWRAGRHRTGLMVGLAVAAGPDLFIGYWLWGVGATWLAPTFGVIFGLTAGLTGGLAAGLAWGLIQRPAAISKPSQLVAQGVTYELTLATTVAVIFGIVFSVQWLGDFVSSLWPANSAATPWIVLENVARFYGPVLLPFYLPKAFLLGLACGIVVTATSPWLLYLVTTRSLARGHLLPANPAAFLDWAYNAGLVRLSGIHAQFRHDELRKHLSSRPVTEPATQQAANPAKARPWRAVAVSASLLGVFILATTAAPGEIAPVSGSQIAAQEITPPTFPEPAITASSSPASVVFAFFTAVNHRQWTDVWRLGAKNLGIPRDQLAQRLPRTVNEGIFITSAFGNQVSVLLVTVGSRNQAQVYHGIYTVSKGEIISRTQSLVATGPSEGLFPPARGHLVRSRPVPHHKLPRPGYQRVPDLSGLHQGPVVSLRHIYL